jgi:hypothetical protein
MIKFFRQIRFDLIEKNNTGKYLKYAIGEIILVVIGILIALQINHNAENNKTDKTRNEYYIQLLEDLNKDKQFINETIVHFQNEDDAYSEYLRTYENTELSPQQVYNHLLKLSIYSTAISFNSNTIESLRSSGEIILIPLSIRNKLIDLLRIQDDILKNHQLNDTGKNNMLQDLGIYRGASTLNSRLENHPLLKSYLQFDENLPQIILGLDAVAIWKNISENSSRTQFELMLEEIEAVINLIELEIKI